MRTSKILAAAFFMPLFFSCSQKDQWFRPVDVTAAPDGSLFIADWYDPGVGGHQVIDLNRGRIYRVTKNKSGYKILNPRLKIPRFQMMPRKGVHRTHIRIACIFSLRTDQCIFCRGRNQKE